MRYLVTRVWRCEHSRTTSSKMRGAHRPHWPPATRALLIQIVFVFSLYYATNNSRASGQRTASINRNQINQRTLTANQQMAMALLTSSGKTGLDSELIPYKCAQHCACSVVQTLDSFKGQLVNLTRASCKSSQFSDVLTIDRRTQIIHISLPADPELSASSSLQQSGGEQPAGSGRDKSQDLDQASKQILSQSKRKQQIELMTKLLNINVTEAQQSQEAKFIGDRKQQQQQQQQFRMPRLMQFTLLREIVIVNLRIEVCDSEIFKRNQRLLKLKWNFNQLKQVSKSCFRHLDKLLELNLDYNRLDELESALFSPLVNLRHLSLAHNQLSELTAHQFANLTRLQSLNLVGNSFKLINLNLLEPMASTLQLLILAKNQIRQFIVAAPATSNQTGSSSNPLAGVMFRNLIKLNVDFNKFERVKLLQLHRFFNVKFLSMRGNNIASIRDKAFNGLKLVELNLAQNKLISITRCAFCNSTIKRLNLAENNISSSSSSSSLLPLATPAPLFPAPDPSQLAPSAAQLVAAPAHQAEVTQSSLMMQPPASSASMLVLSQSILGPLFGHLEYLDLSENRQIAQQLEFLLEPLLELQYLNLAATGLDRALPTPTLFKNLRRLRYLNLSRNHLDQIVAETIEPLVELELLDLSQNDFSELDESFLVTMDELPVLKFVNLASNPWYCSQCKIGALYDWIARSPIYNATCLAQAQQQQQVAATSSSPADLPVAGVAGDSQDGEPDTAPLAPGQEGARPDEDTNLGFIYRQRATQADARGPQDYTLLDSPGDHNHLPASAVDFDLILNLFEGDAGSTAGLLGTLEETLSGAGGASASSQAPNYQLVPPPGASAADDSQALVSQFRDKKRLLSERLLKSLASPEDDRSIARTIASLLAGAQLAGGPLALEASELLLKSYFGQPDLCLKCEFPSELRSFNLHELAPADFKYCAGSAPRFAASEPKIGLTLAIVIIGALFVVIIVVIVMYRKKSNAYYPGEDLAEQLEAGRDQQQQLTGGMKKPVLSISSDADHQYGDNTDYSSPPMSQSYSGEESYTEQSQDPNQDEDEDDEELDPDEDEDEELDEDEYDDDEEEDGDEQDDDFDEDEDEQPGADGGGSGPSEAGTGGAGQRGGGASPPPPHPDNHQQHRQDSGGAATHPKARFEEEQTQTRPEVARGGGGSPPSQQQQQPQAKKSSRQSSRELSTSASRSRSTTSGGGPGNLAAVVVGSPHAPSSTLSSMVASPAASAVSGTPQSHGHQANSLNRSQGSQSGNQRAGRGSGAPAKQMTHNDRDDSTPIYIGPKQLRDSVPGNVLSPSSSLDRGPGASVELASTTPASLSAGDLLAAAASSVAATQTPDISSSGSGATPSVGSNSKHHKGHKLVQLASLAGSLHESHSRAMTRAKRAKENAQNAKENAQNAQSAQEENSHYSASSNSRSSESRPNESQTKVAPMTTPKTILHHHTIQHRHSSESHSTNVPGPVSFAPSANSDGRYSGAGGGDGPRRDRLQRTPQTICVDQVQAGASHRNQHQVGFSGGAGIRETSGRVGPRHQMTTLATSSGHERSSGRQLEAGGSTRALNSGRQEIFVSQASNGRTLVDFTPTSTLATQTRVRPQPPVMTTTITNSAPRQAESSADLMEFARDSATPGTKSAAPTTFSPVLHNTIANNDNNSDKPARPGRALRGRPLVKQPHPHLPPAPLPELNHQVEQQIIRFDDDDDDYGEDHEAAESFDAEAQLADLPSDLDETDLDQMLLAEGPPSSAMGGGGALEFDQEHDEFADEQVPVSLAHYNNNNLRNSHSTHSALTQTGSRDFES